MIQSLQEMMELAKQCPSQKIAVVAAEDDSSLEAIKLAIEEDIAEAILVGDKEKIEKEMKKLQMGTRGLEIVDEKDHDCAALRSVEMVHNKAAGLLMKGKIHTDSLLRAVLDKDKGLRTGSLLSHAFAMESPHYHKMFFLTDAAMNIAPTLDQKAQIIQNVVNLARETFGYDRPKVAVICAVETVNPKMECTNDAACLSKMAARGQISGAIVDGPLAFDNAISKESAEIKEIKSAVAGDPDVLFFPEIQSGNSVYKAMMYLGLCRAAGIVLGAAAPVILTSRADSTEIKLSSIALCALASMKGKHHQ
jgi:phosphate butyryltransferase